MPETVSTLLYGTGLDITGFEKSATDIRRRLEKLGEEATKTFDQRISRSLANSVDPARLKAGVDQATKLLESIGIKTGDTFRKTLGTNLARETLKPFVEESSTFLGQLKSGFTSTLGVGKIAFGVGLGSIFADVVRGLGSAAAAAVQMAADFELAMAKVQTIADKGFDVSKVSEQIEDMSRRIPESAASLAQGLFSIVGSGVRSTSDALNVLETSAKAAVAGVSSTGEAAKSIVFVLNAYGKSAVEASHISDVLFKTVDEGVVEFSELAASIGDVVGPAALAKASIEDVSAGIATITKAGISAAETVTAMRRLIGEIVAPSDKAAAAAKAMGIELSQAGLKAAGGFAPFIRQIAEITKGDITKLRAIFPEERAFRAAAILAGTMTGEFKRLAEQFNDLNQVAGATERAFSVINETATFQWKLFKNNLSVAVIDLGQGILNFLKPALQGINDIFDDTSPLDKTIAKMKELGVEAEKIELLTLRSSLIKTQEQLKNAQAELDRTILTLQNAEESFISLAAAGGGAGGVTIAFAKGTELATKQFAKQLDTVGGLLAAEEKRAALASRQGEILNLLGLAQADNDAARIKALELTRDNLDGQIDAIDKLIKSQLLVNAAVEQEESTRRKIRLLEEFRTSTEKEIQERAQAALKETEKIEKQIDEAKKNRDREAEVTLRKSLVAQRDVVSVAGLFVTVQRQATAATAGTVEQLEKQKKAAEDAAKFIADAAKKMELLAAADDPERRLIAIRQEADERRKAFEGQAKAIEAAGRLQQAEQARVIKDFGDKLRKEVEQRIEKIVKLDIEPKLITKVKLPEIDLSDFGIFTKKQAEKIREDIDNALSTALVLDELKTKTLSQRINKTLNEALVESPASILLNKISDFGALLDEEFINFVGIIDKGFADILAGIANFAQQISSGNVLGAITSLVGTLRSLFARGGKTVGVLEEEREAEEKRRAALEREEIRANELAEAFERLREAMLGPQVTARELIDSLGNMNLRLGTLNRTLALSGVRIGTEQISAIREALEEFQRVTGGELPTNLNELILQLSALDRADLQPILQQLSLVPPSLQEAVFNLLREFGVVLEGIEEFGEKSRNSFTGLFADLQLKFDLLNIENPVEQLNLLAETISEKFGAVLPRSVEDIRKFIADGLSAIEAGGQQLLDFLASANLEELTAEEFTNLLRTLNEFSQGIDIAGGSIADALADLLDKLQLEFQLLDIEDPIKQLRRLREEIEKQFGAVVPETLEGIDDLIKSGLQALLAGGDALKAFLASINLEEFTEEQFRNFLESLEGLGDEAARQIEEATAAAEEITTSQVKSITFQQANKLIDEVTTIRVAVTQMLDQMRLGALANLPNINLGNLAAALSGINAGIRNNYFIVRNGGVEKVSESQLSEIDRRLIEQARASAQARGIN